MTLIKINVIRSLAQASTLRPAAYAYASLASLRTSPHVYVTSMCMWVYAR